jgi:hypothetical protein
LANAGSLILPSTPAIVAGMSKNGAGNTHNIATWLRAKEFSKIESDYDARWVNGKQRLVAELNRKPELRSKAAKLHKSGLTDPWDILYRLELIQ